MKKYLTPIVSCAIGVTLCSFNVKTTCFFLIYNSGPQNLLSSYGVTTSEQSPCDGDEVLCWLRICKGNNVLTQSDLTTVFNVLNVTNPSLNTLDDEVETDFGSTHLEKKAS